MRDYGGNCLLGAVWLMVRHRSFCLRASWRGRTVPHFFVRVGESWWHFRLVRDVLPHPLCYLWFRGRFDSISNKSFLKLHK